MGTTIPSHEWYKDRSKELAAPTKCPFAHHRKCPKYFETVTLLTDVNVISGLKPDERRQTLKYWEDAFYIQRRKKTKHRYD